MSTQRDNEVKRCKRRDCARATFVETDEGISCDFRHGSQTHREVYTVAQMKVYLASQGYVVVAIKELGKAA